MEENLQVELYNNSTPWSIDVWSLGVLLVEIISGFPTDMEYKCRIT